MLASTQLGYKRKLLLDQKNAEELMKLGMFAELRKWCNPKDDNAKIYPCEISRFGPACRLDAVVCERAHGSLRARACIARRCRNLDLAGYLVQILDDIKSGEADPSENKQGGNYPSPHARIIHGNWISCQVMV